MFPPEVADQIAEKLTRESLRQICSEEGMPDRRTVERWMQEDGEFAAKCARARVIQAEHVFDGMEQLEDQMLTGEVDAAAGRSVLASRQWRLSKMLPKRFGDKLDLNHSGRIATSREMSEEELASIAAGSGG